MENFTKKQTVITSFGTMIKRCMYVCMYICMSFSAKAQVPIYSETFSNGNLGTTTAANGINGNWVWSNTCARSSMPNHSAGGHAFFLGNGSSCMFGEINGNTVSGNLSTPPIAIPANGAYITFNYSIQNECSWISSTCSYDILSFQLSNNGGTTFNTITNSNTGTLTVNNNGWVAVSYTLPLQYTNTNIIIRFNFNDIDGFDSFYDGIYIDDIIVTGFCTPPTVSITASADTICQGTPITLAASGTASNYTLTVSGNSTGTVANTPLTITPSVSTTYVMLGEDNTGCMGISSSQYIHVVPAPVVNIWSIYPAAVCSGGTATMSIGGATDYFLEPGGIILSGISSYTFIPDVSTTYSLTGTNSYGCMSSNTSVKAITVKPTPTISVNSGTICSGQSFSLSPVGGGTYVYSPFGADEVVSPPTGVYSYTVNSSLDGCVGNPAVSGLTVYAMPNTFANASNIDVCKTQTVSLNASGADSYLWSTGATTSISSVGFVNTPTGTVVYTVTGTNSGACSKTATVQITVNACVGIEEQQTNINHVIVYPNPSNGKLTAELNKKGLEKNITLTDLTGRVVMTHKTTNEKIDFNISELNSGIYFLQVQSGAEKHTVKVVKE
ncbi:MAG: T9SS type A sorting domain-containing protein [Bacteroidetes bacterium]|nr:T9SS type A sorting domain-containing protein [Bacteroidota bacterium]